MTIATDNNVNLNISNNVGLSSVEALKLMMNKRKLESTVTINTEEKHQENGNETAKRMCIVNDQQNYGQK